MELTRVVKTKFLDVVYSQPRVTRSRRKCGERRAVTAREDVLLDEIGAVAIRLIPGAV